MEVLIEKCNYVNKEYRVIEAFSIDREWFFQPGDTIRIIKIKFNDNSFICKVSFLKGEELILNSEDFHALIEFLDIK